MAKRKATKPVKTIEIGENTNLPAKIEGKEVSTMDVPITEIILIPPATVKTLYETNANTNAFTDNEKTKLDGIQALAQVNDTGAEMVVKLNAVLGGSDWQTDTDTQLTNAQVVAAVDAELGNTDWQTPGSGGGLSREVDQLEIAAGQLPGLKIVRLGGATVPVFGGTAAAGYTIDPPADTEVLRMTFEGNSNTANANGELVFIFDNTPNGYAREFTVDISNLPGGQDTDEPALGHVVQNSIAGNVTTITIPNIGGNYPNGFRALIR